MLLFKVDFEKAFDTVSWKFLDHMLLCLGFGNRWQRWIQVCLHSTRAFVLINGSPSREFPIKRGLRQGDPLNRFQAKLSTWKGGTLSIGGRLTLITSVLGSLGNYYMSIFKCPKSVLNSLEAIRASFFWGGSGEKIKMSWLKWENVMASFDNDSIWARVIMAIHGMEAGVDLMGCNCNGVWASITSTYSMLHDRNILSLNTLSRKVGNGSSIRFWKDPWNGSRNEDVLEVLVSDFGQVQLLDMPDSWSWNLDDDNVFLVHATRVHFDSCLLPIHCGKREQSKGKRGE
ncbi:RNA-directed DNA polymerase, eukaryota, reverse transcriptase zinc-binding domain protein [Tanacetum coccineum]|uniref:RNA-directed DNA polymerase, eukaryota, reverse transcriptase zinc-binding domain protein n=1 Tax=Tanacetum coccineum TaxID=301880 RepID=A0ABQ5IGQ3_9ASTR